MKAVDSVAQKGTNTQNSERDFRASPIPLKPTRVSKDSVICKAMEFQRNGLSGVILFTEEHPQGKATYSLEAQRLKKHLSLKPL